MVAQAEMMRLARRAMEALVMRAGAGGMVRPDGALELYESEAEWRASLPGWQTVDNPHSFARALFAYAERLGVLSAPRGPVRGPRAECFAVICMHRAPEYLAGFPAACCGE
jgi:hypothetical protein